MRLYSSRVSTASGCKSAVIEIDGAVIKSVEETPVCPPDAVDYGSMRIIPGVFDTHNHGTKGFDLMMHGDDRARHECVCGYLRGLASQGVTSVFPTISDPMMMRVVAHAARDGAGRGAAIAGIHAEGPWLSRVGEKGVRTGWPEVSLDTARQMVEASEGMLKLVALAPEIPGIDALVSFFLEQGVTVAAAHSDNTYAAAKVAYDRGISVATHTGNVMTDMHHRDVGGLGAALLNDRVMCEVICDGMHVCNEMLDIYFRIKSPRFFMMISDCTAFSGAPAGRYSNSMVSEMTVTDSGFVLSDTGRLMGSSQPVLFGIGNLVDHVGIPLEQCLEMACLNPARTYGCTHKGAIASGMDADMVVVSDGWQAEATYVSGCKVYDRSADGEVFNEAFLEAHLMPAD